ncbi:MAG TPA: pitrilysin family protein [candidate division Zixibacteria bacterium]|nr:pitrilysin family protein [candidate division Zixibacteria bacterium]
MTVTTNPLRPTPGSPRPYHFPDFDRRQLDNGLTVWTVPLPGSHVVSVHLLVDAGAAAEDEAKAGVAALTAQLLVTGTRRLDAAQFAEATERLGIEVSSESSWDSARAAFQSLPEHVEEGIALLAEMVREPRLDPAEFERLRAERLADIMQARADPGRLAEEMFLRHVYDASTPYRRLSGGVPETVSALTLDDVRAHHDAHWRPGRAHLVVVGWIDPEAVMRAAQLAFGEWQGEGVGHRPVNPVPAGLRRVIIVDRPGSVQSELRVGHIGIERTSDRYFPALVTGALLGGVFGSRLNLRLREELGYTYGARAGFDPRRAPGPFSAATAVQTEVTTDAIRELLGQLDRIRAEAPGERELREVRDFLVGVFPLRFETTGGVALAIEPLAVYGLPDDYWQTYRSHLEAVTPDEVLATARALIRPDELVILAVGDAARIADELREARFGPTEVVQPLGHPASAASEG